MKKPKTTVPPAPAPIVFPRADPEALRNFDPATKQCTMNCGPHRDDPRSRAECKFLCDDCIEVNTMGYIESLDDRVSKLVQIYTERNNCAIALVKAAIAAGWKAGRGTDPVAVESWSNVVYIDLPNGKQVSYHISPDQAHLLEGLPAYDGQWDGTYVGRDPNWAGF